MVLVIRLFTLSHHLHLNVCAHVGRLFVLSWSRRERDLYRRLVSLAEGDLRGLLRSWFVSERVLGVVERLVHRRELSEDIFGVHLVIILMVHVYRG